MSASFPLLLAAVVRRSEPFDAQFWKKIAGQSAILRSSSFAARQISYRILNCKS